jgi:SAM-dependent methyltransferase
MGTGSGNVTVGLAARAAASLRLRAADAADRVLGRRTELTPPRRLQQSVGDSDFVATGEEFGRLLDGLGVLRADARVLDVGCGAGRIARVLATRLRPPGSYDGFDVMADAVAWCAQVYRGARLAVPFRFVHADIANALYNPGGRLRAGRYRFPYDDGAFDLVLATSVFTHLLADTAAHYVAEAARVLAPGGVLFATWFLVRPDAARSDRALSFRFSAFEGGPAFVADPALPEAAVGYERAWVEARLDAAGLASREPPLLGTWAGTAGTSFQDIVIARRR